MENQISFDLVLDLLRSDGCIIVNKNLARNIGLDCAVLYSELASKHLYFKKKSQLTEDGFFFNTVDNLQEDTSLSDYQQRNCIKKLIKLGLMENRVKGLPAKRYFKIVQDFSTLVKYLKPQENQQVSRNLNTGFEETKIQQSQKLNGNNTNPNNNKFNNNNLSKVSSPSDLTATVKETNRNLFTPKALRLFEFFEDRYFGINFSSHPPINDETIEQFNNLVENGELYDRKLETDRWVNYEGLKEMINLYFDTRYELKTGGYADHRIWHFLSESVLVNLFYNCGLL